MSHPENTAPYRLVEPGGAYASLLRIAFNQVCNLEDWKAPVNCMVPLESVEVYANAIKFMTGTEATREVTRQDGQDYVRLKSVGYRMGPAGP